MASRSRLHVPGARRAQRTVGREGLPGGGNAHALFARCCRQDSLVTHRVSARRRQGSGRRRQGRDWIATLVAVLAGLGTLDLLEGPRCHVCSRRGGGENGEERGSEGAVLPPMSSRIPWAVAFVTLSF